MRIQSCFIVNINTQTRAITFMLVLLNYFEKKKYHGRNWKDKFSFCQNKLRLNSDLQLSKLHKITLKIFILNKSSKNRTQSMLISYKSKLIFANHSKFLIIVLHSFKFVPITYINNYTLHNYIYA